METKIIGTITSNKGIKYFVRYKFDDQLLEINTSNNGLWQIIRDYYRLDQNALKYAQDFVDNSTI